MNNQRASKLAIMQSLGLKEKILLSKRRIEEWYDYHSGNVYVSFSGGKDSTVLLHLVRSMYPDVKAVFVNTGLEYPEIVEFVKTRNNVEIIRPKMNFKKVLDHYGYPVVSKEQSQYINDAKNTKSDKLRNLRLNGREDSRQGMISNKWKFLVDSPFKISHKCCEAMKKRPFKKYEKESGNLPYIGLMAGDSSLRKQIYVSRGCNSFEGHKQSNPLMTWKESDIWQYIKEFNVDYCKVYDYEGITRTGCIFCMFGVHLEKGTNRFQSLAKTHPQLHSYCMHKLGLKDILEYIGVKTGLEPSDGDQLNLF